MLYEFRFPLPCLLHPLGFDITYAAHCMVTLFDIWHTLITTTHSVQARMQQCAFVERNGYMTALVVFALR